MADKILIVDDDKLVCSSLKTILEAQGQTIAGIGCSGREALQLYRETNPDDGYPYGGDERRGCQ